jgi:hypothetical protein
MRFKNHELILTCNKERKTGKIDEKKHQNESAVENKKLRKNHHTLKNEHEVSNDDGVNLKNVQELLHTITNMTLITLIITSSIVDCLHHNTTLKVQCIIHYITVPCIRDHINFTLLLHLRIFPLIITGLHSLIQTHMMIIHYHTRSHSRC